MIFLFQDDLKLAVQQGGTLLSCIKEPVSKDPNCKLTPDELENMATVERFVQCTKVVLILSPILFNAKMTNLCVRYRKTYNGFIFVRLTLTWSIDK